MRAPRPLTISLATIGLGCVIVMVWAYRSGGVELLIAAIATTIIICAVGSMQVVFNAIGRKKKPGPSLPRIVVKEEEPRP